MGQLLTTVEKLALMGANIEITEDSGCQPRKLESIVRMASDAGGHVTINASGQSAHTLEHIARIGRSHVTFRF